MQPANRPVQGQTEELVQPATQQAADGQPQPWEQQPGEPNLWFSRFQLYLELGLTRTLQKAYRRCAAQRDRPSPSVAGHPNPHWCDAARRWQWRARAQVWDLHQRELFALTECNLRLAQRERRVAIIEDYLERACTAIDSAHIDDLDQDLARQLFPQLRVFLRDLLAAERQEFARDPFGLDSAVGEDGALAITADDLRAAQRQMEREDAAQRARLSQPQTQPPQPQTLTPDAPPAPFSPPAASRRSAPGGRMLFVCADPQHAPLLDLGALRDLRSATGLQFNRLLHPIRRKFAAHLHRERSLGHPVELLQLALPSSPAGVAFDDILADGGWLRPRLAGIQLLLLTCWSGSHDGGWLPAVPFVVTLDERMGKEDAAAFCRAFWRQIGWGQEPGAALEETLSQCSPRVNQSVMRWKSEPECAE